MRHPSPLSLFNQSIRDDLLACSSTEGPTPCAILSIETLLTPSHSHDPPLPLYVASHTHSPRIYTTTMFFLLNYFIKIFM